MKKTDKPLNGDCPPTSQEILTTAKWGQEAGTTPSCAIVSAVAEATESDPTELPPLYDTINPEVLNEFFEALPNSIEKEVYFQYMGYNIIVKGDSEGEVQLVSSYR